MASGGHSMTAVVFCDTMKHTFCIYFSDGRIEKNVFKSETHIQFLRQAYGFRHNLNCMKRSYYIAIPILSNF
jgi:hypothetical protein